MNLNWVSARVFLPIEDVAVLIGTTVLFRKALVEAKIAKYIANKNNLHAPDPPQIADEKIVSILKDNNAGNILKHQAAAR